MSTLNEKYQKAKSAKVGENCECPSCGSKFVKTNYQQAFCKTKGNGWTVDIIAEIFKGL